MYASAGHDAHKNVWPEIAAGRLPEVILCR